MQQNPGLDFLLPQPLPTLLPVSKNGGPKVHQESRAAIGNSQIHSISGMHQLGSFSNGGFPSDVCIKYKHDAGDAFGDGGGGDGVRLRYIEKDQMRRTHSNPHMS